MTQTEKQEIINAFTWATSIHVFERQAECQFSGSFSKFNLPFIHNDRYYIVHFEGFKWSIDDGWASPDTTWKVCSEVEYRKLESKLAKEIESARYWHKNKSALSMLAFFKQECIRFSRTDVPNIVTIIFDEKEYDFSLTTSKVFVNKHWVKISRDVLKLHTEMTLAEALNRRAALLTFGKYKGRDINKMTTAQEIQYLHWLSSQYWLSVDLRPVILRHLESLNFNSIVKMQPKKLKEYFNILRN